jgi:hypothetical protein
MWPLSLACGLQIFFFGDGIPTDDTDAVFYFANGDIGEGQGQGALFQMPAESVALVGEINVAMDLAVEDLAVEGANVERLYTLGITFFRW